MTSSLWGSGVTTWLALLLAPCGVTDLRFNVAENGDGVRLFEVAVALITWACGDLGLSSTASYDFTTIFRREGCCFRSTCIIFGFNEPLLGKSGTGIAVEPSWVVTEILMAEAAMVLDWEALFWLSWAWCYSCTCKIPGWVLWSLLGTIGGSWRWILSGIAFVPLRADVC